MSSRITGRAIESPHNVSMVAPNGIEIISNPIENEDGTRSFVFAVIIPESMYAAADPFVGAAFTALGNALRGVKP